MEQLKQNHKQVNRRNITKVGKIAAVRCCISFLTRQYHKLSDFKSTHLLSGAPSQNGLKSSYWAGIAGGSAVKNPPTETQETRV